MSKEIEANVEKFLSDNNVRFAVAYIGETVKNDNWQCDQWRVEFAKDKKQMQEMFHTGLGHRQWDKMGKLEANNFKGSRNSIYYADLEKQHKKPVKPSSAIVLHSLLLDASASDESFNDWCDNFGYNSDSMKDFATYQACCEIGKKLATIFTREQMQALRDMLQDY